MTISVKHLSVELEDTKILDDISVQIPINSFTCILGENGAGKSTLLGVIANEISEYSGFISKIKKTDLVYLPQDLDSPPFLTVSDIVSLGFYNANFPKQKITLLSKQLINKCGIKKIKNQLFENISVGEKQRTWIAFALAQSKDFILMDEPLSSVDTNSRKDFYELLKRIVATGKTIILVSHDIEDITLYADYIVKLKNGKKTFEGQSEELV